MEKQWLFRVHIYSEQTQSNTHTIEWQVTMAYASRATRRQRTISFPWKYGCWSLGHFASKGLRRLEYPTLTLITKIFPEEILWNIKCHRSRRPLQKNTKENNSDNIMGGFVLSIPLNVVLSKQFNFPLSHTDKHNKYKEKWHWQVGMAAFLKLNGSLSSACLNGLGLPYHPWLLPRNISHKISLFFSFQI